MKDRVAILTSDAMVDPRFGAGDSIRFHGIRSAMCAPLWHEDQVIGIIHVDSPMLTNCFTENDLDVLTALASYAAVAVERARLGEKIVAEEKKRERLGRFLSPQVASRILAASDAQSAELGPPEVREVSVLFADISGFTTVSERMSPSSVALLLNDYLSRMTEVIFRYEGTLDKYMGDGIMAVFGAPLDMPDHAARAIRVALEMQERVAEWNAERTEGPELKIRIGINSGKAVAGEIGSVNKMEYTVLGDIVNTASRLESSVAKPGVGGHRREHLRKRRGLVRLHAPRGVQPQGQGAGGSGLRGVGRGRRGHRDLRPRCVGGHPAGPRPHDRRRTPAPPGSHPLLDPRSPVRHRRRAPGPHLVPPRLAEPREPPADPEAGAARQGPQPHLPGRALREEPPRPGGGHRPHPRDRRRPDALFRPGGTGSASRRP